MSALITDFKEATLLMHMRQRTVFTQTSKEWVKSKFRESSKFLFFHTSEEQNYERL